MASPESTKTSSATPIDGVAGIDEDVLGALAAFDLRGATEAICAAVDALNRDLETTRPWELIRLATPANRRLEELLGRYLASLGVIAAAVRPIVPALAGRVESLLVEGPQGVQTRLAGHSAPESPRLPAEPGRPVSRSDRLGHPPGLPHPSGDLHAIPHAEFALDVGDVTLDGAQ